MDLGTISVTLDLNGVVLAVATGLFVFSSLVLFDRVQTAGWKAKRAKKQLPGYLERFKQGKADGDPKIFLDSAGWFLFDYLPKKIEFIRTADGETYARGHYCDMFGIKPCDSNTWSIEQVEELSSKLQSGKLWFIWY